MLGVRRRGFVGTATPGTGAASQNGRSVVLTGLVSGGGGGTTVTHGSSFTLTGTNLGTNALNIAFTGGSGGMIESTAAGVEVADTFSGFNMAGGSAGMSRGKKLGYADATRGSVFTSTFDGSNPFPDCGAFSYDVGVGGIPLGSTLYKSWWHYATGVNAFSSGQWKWSRETFIDDITDPNTNTYLSFANQASGLMLLVHPFGGTGAATIASGTGTALVSQNTWMRVEEVITYPSVQGGTTSHQVRIWNGSNTPANLSFTFSSGANNNALNIYPDSSRVRYIIMQHYLGNGNTQGTIRQDDHYFQIGTRRRVEMQASATFALGKGEIQKPTAWSSTSITLQINAGAFTPGTYWLHVVDDTDASISATQITLN